MTSLLNTARPPLFCPGCSHERIVQVLDRTFQKMQLDPACIVMVSDIGCSGLFDTFFNTHAMHGLHGRALTYAAGIKMARPELTVVVTMGDGGLGIGGAHYLSACRRNLDLTLLILNNFNFGMTGGQYSATTPPDALVGSSFLNRLEPPLDPCRVAAAAGAPYVVRCSSYRKDLVDVLEGAIRFEGFSVVDLWGICTGRFSKRNRWTPQRIDEALAELPVWDGMVEENRRREYGGGYREEAASRPHPGGPLEIEAAHRPPAETRQEICVLGNAGQRIITAGEILCLAGITAGLHATQKNEYNITVLRGPSISEVILSPEPIDYTGIKQPSAVLALNDEGVQRRRGVFTQLNDSATVLKARDVDIPECRARIHEVDFKAQGIRSQDRALAAIGVLAKLEIGLTPAMLESALRLRFAEAVLTSARELVGKVEPGRWVARVRA